MVSEVVVEGKDGVEVKMIYQGKTGAVGIAQFSILKFPEKGLCSFGDIVRDGKGNYCSGLKLGHKLNGGFMTASHLQECVGFVEDIIRGVKKGFSPVNLFVMRFCGLVMFIVGNGKGAKSAGIYKNLQLCSPYRNLS